MPGYCRENDAWLQAMYGREVHGGCGTVVAEPFPALDTRLARQLTPGLKKLQYTSGP